MDKRFVHHFLDEDVKKNGGQTISPGYEMDKSSCDRDKVISGLIISGQTITGQNNLDNANVDKTIMHLRRVKKSSVVRELIRDKIRIEREIIDVD